MLILRYGALELVFVDGRELGFSFDEAFALRRALNVVVEELEGEQRSVLFMKHVLSVLLTEISRETNLLSYHQFKSIAQILLF